MKHPLLTVGALALTTTLMTSCGGAAAADAAAGPSSTSPTCTKTALTIGATATANTGSGMCKDGNGNSGNFFTLTVTQPTAVTFAMTGNAFPGYLGLFYDNGQAIMQKNANSLPLAIPVVLGPGTYTVIGGSLSSADGPYSLVTTALSLNACVEKLMATEGAIVTGTLSGSSCIDEGGNRTQVVTWAARTAKTLAFTVTLDKKAAVLFNGGAANISQVGGPGNVTGTMPTQLLNTYNMASVLVTHLAALAPLPITYTIKAD